MNTELKFYCPCCESDTDRLYEGYCEPCLENKQDELLNHNFNYNRWEKLSEQERNTEIKRVINYDNY